jgi:2-(1,2-epoxy-1,2-dihydrophenyl)acetyl-CoA isomerase
MDYETVKIDLVADNSIAVIELNRPDALNAINPQLATDFVAAIKELEKNEGIRAVVITGKGKAFSAGGDLAAFKASQNPKNFLYDLAKIFHAGIISIRQMRAPVIAAINGACFGVGLSLACCCDFRISSATAKFCFAFTGVGLSPDSSLPFFLPKIVGLGKATEMALMNPVLNAQEALAIDLVSKVTEPDSLVSDALAMANKLAQMPTVAIAKIKKLYNDCYTDTLENHLDKQLLYLRETAATEDFQEGSSAFLEKRKPVFRGR